ncbi:hypothetical protein C3486_11940 [Streptomyces sp. Ru73]|uniref:hypothetical protein n=1 Tax=Streptomyces sp. Ru73 TaxID=2080748 RepID=UPI000CDD7E20|nr:hypothetical protein [Streptomyces sp. Ru73]POX40893.1 hypothetical protein C3486_11940 [Streptomyces sp. Ru73]
MGKRSDSSGEWEKPFWQQRGWIVSAVFLLAVVVVAAVALVVRGGESEPPAQDDTRPKASPSASQGDDSQADDRPAGCKTDDSDQEKPTKAPADMLWKTYGTVPVPVSATYGPKKFDGNIWSCYAHTPMGAALAVNAITDKLPYPGWRDVVEKQFVPGAARDKLIKQRAKEKDDPRNSTQESGGNFYGFSVLTYAKEQATVQILLKVGEEYATASVSLKWLDGDWKVDPQPNGSPYSGFSQTSGPEGFVKWGS